MYMLVAEPITGQISQHITQLNKAINRVCAVLINAHLYVVHSGLSVASYVYAKKGHFQCNGQHQIIAFLLALYVMVTYIARYNVEKTPELGLKYFRSIANIAP